jgi:hypothetical protein|tara:strand:- start:3973 stop:6282 length:2310 start_codon:yes stop_codon:yes gene_type:complete
MGTFPKFSNIAGYATKTLESRKRSVYNVSKLNAWVRVTSAVSGNKGDGLTLVSNPNFRLFGAAGVSSIYGINKQSGTIGETWGGSPINPSEGQGYKPSPIIESIEIDEGAGNLSRKANFTIKCFSKDQMELITEYFQEPGFTVFLEWGWNTPDSMKGLVKKLNANNIANFQNFKNLTTKREASKGQYDNYLGFITGGGIATEGENWTVEVKCTGFTELPAYLVNGDNSGDAIDKKSKKEPDYKNLSLETDLNIKRWMFAYNALPSNRKTAEIKSLATKTDDSLRKVPIAQAVNYINFDETITDSLNNKADGTAVGRFFGVGGSKEKGEDGNTERIEIPAGTKIVGSEKFIRFGTLMKIMNQMIIKGLKIGKKTVSMEIHSEHTICSAYPNIFSTDKSKLLIPNIKTPRFSFLDAKNNTKSLEAIPSPPEDCSIEYDGRKIQFPFENAINGGSVLVDGTSYDLQYKDGTTPASECIDKPQGKWGFLDDLYVNFDFASGIMGTSNFTVKDALYQILNGMSSAVNDLWNFQIMETTLENDKGKLKKGDQIITIQETNFTYKPKVNPYTFNLIGTDSIFKDASLNLDMSAAKMNQVIGSRLAKKINGETQPLFGRLDAGNITDLVLKEIDSRKEAPIEEKSGKETDEELKEKNYANFLGKIGTYPKVQFEKKDIKPKYVVQEKTYASVYDDKQLLKMAKSDMEEEEGVSILLPINFTFTVYGVSGIKRGDRFAVKGIPAKYEKQGFFQVLGVKHTIQGMEWLTEVEGGFRNNT